MHNVISSCFFLSGEQSWAEGRVEEGWVESGVGGVGGGLYVGGCGVVGAERLFCFLFQFLTFFDFLLMLSIYFPDCVSTL